MTVSLYELYLNGDLWTALGGAALTGLAVLVALAAFARKPIKRRWAIICVVGLAAGVTGTCLTAPHPNDVLVRGEGATLLLSPFDGADINGSLVAGERGRVTKTHGDYAYVKSPTGSAGWLGKDEVSRFTGSW